MSNSLTFYRLNEQQLLLITGPDAGKFLQGQVTCDVRELDQGRCIAGAHCTYQGRMLANFLAQKVSEDSIGLALPNDTAPVLSASLGKYIVFSKAKISASDWRGIGVSGNSAAQRLGELLDCTAPSPGHSLYTESFVLARLDANNLELWCGDEMRQQLLDKALAENHLLGDDNDWRLLQIRAGRGQVVAATVESFIPQMLNMQYTGGISFSKGCYTGQEIVARMEYRGKQKRHMYRLGCDGNAHPNAGSAVISGEGDKVGEVVMSARDAASDRLELLAVLNAAKLEQALLLEEYPDSPLQVLSLPYAIT